MNKSPLFTIITPVFNRSSIVAKTIESVTNQNFKDFEYLLIDDGSTDNTVEVVEEAISNYDNFKLIKLDSNIGRCAARNEGLRNTTGKWICYLDSDDLYYENHLTVMSELIDSHTEYKAFAVDQNINGELKKYRRASLHKDNITLNLQDFIEDNPFTANQICHAKELGVSWSNERISFSEDWLFLRSLSLKTDIFKRSIVTNNLIDHADRSMNKSTAEKFVHYNLKAANKFIEENELSTHVINRITTYTNLLCVNVLLKNDLKKDAFQIFKKCLRTNKAYSYKLFYKAIIKFLL